MLTSAIIRFPQFCNSFQTCEVSRTQCNANSAYLQLSHLYQVVEVPMSWAFVVKQCCCFPWPAGWCAEGKVPLWYLFQTLLSHHNPFRLVRYLWLQWVSVVALTLLWCSDMYFRHCQDFFSFSLCMGKKLISVFWVFWASRCILKGHFLRSTDFWVCKLQHT